MALMAMRASARRMNYIRQACVRWMKTRTPKNYRLICVMAEREIPKQRAGRKKEALPEWKPSADVAAGNRVNRRTKKPCQ